MKVSTLAWTGLITCVLLVSGAMAQLKQPLSVNPVGFNGPLYEEVPIVEGPIYDTHVIVGEVAPAEAAAPTPVADAASAGEAAADSVLASSSESAGNEAAGGGCSPAGCAPPAAAPGCAAPAEPGCAAPAAACCAPAAPTCGAVPACSPCAAGCGGCGSGCGGGCSLGLCDCNLGDAWTLSGAIHGDCPPCVNVGGWIAAGYHSEANDLFLDTPDQFSVTQLWLYAEKVASCESPFGFRVDAVYGIDADDTQAFGNPPGSWDFLNGLDYDDGYGIAIPQLYGEVALSDTWSIKAGHFYTLIGYEVVTAPDNFFYSHAMTMFNSEPFTHTGVLATGALSDELTVYAGWTLGWDTGFDQLDDGSSWLGGFSVTLSDNAAFTYISTAGNFGWRGDDAYSHSLVFDVSLTDSVNYVLQSDLVRVDGTGEDNVGINQYFLYSVSDCLGLGARMEWWKGDVLTGYAPHGGVLPAAGSLSYYAATFGANIRPHANVVVRPEVRVDWSPAADYDQSYFAIDAIFTF